MSAYDRINARFKKASGGQSLGDRQRYWKSEQEKLKKDLEAHDAEMARRKKEMNREEFGGMIGGSPITNNVSDGNIAGLGVGPQGEPGVNKKRKKSVIPFKTFTRNPQRLA
jgi:hypothetical protein